jgi:uncharacterized membrane protein
MTQPYELWKTLHVVGAAVLFGTGLGIAFFCWFGYRRAMRSGEIGTLRAFLRLTVIADACLTAPAVALQAVSGVALMNLLGWSQASPWALLVWTLFVFVGLCWLPVVAIQIRLSREAQAAPSTERLAPRFHRLFRVWFGLGIPAFAAVVALFYLMVARPLPVTGG